MNNCKKCKKKFAVNEHYIYILLCNSCFDEVRETDKMKKILDYKEPYSTGKTLS